MAVTLGIIMVGKVTFYGKTTPHATARKVKAALVARDFLRTVPGGMDIARPV
jgi:hypothetical protein